MTTNSLSNFIGLPTLRAAVYNSAISCVAYSANTAFFLGIDAIRVRALKHFSPQQPPYPPSYPFKATTLAIAATLNVLIASKVPLLEISWESVLKISLASLLPAIFVYDKASSSADSLSHIFVKNTLLSGVTANIAGALCHTIPPYSPSLGKIILVTSVLAQTYYFWPFVENRRSS